jgi:HK97 family phage prohead protease
VEYKSFKVERVKALGDGESDGTFEAIVSVFGNVDSYGDRVEPGAFATTLQKGFPAVVWTHQWTEPPIGATLDAKETSEGLYVKGRLFIEDNQRAREVYAAMKNLGGDGQPPLREFSFAYDIVNAGWEVVDEEEIFSLKELDLIEVGPCLRGANDQTRLIGVKSDGADGRERPPKPSEGEKSSHDPEAARAFKQRAGDLLTARPE